MDETAKRLAFAPAAKLIASISVKTFVAILPVILIMSLAFMVPAIRDKMPYFQTEGIRFGPLYNTVDVVALIILFGGLCVALTMALVIGAEQIEMPEQQKQPSQLIVRGDTSRLSQALKLAFAYVPRILAILFFSFNYAMAIAMIFGARIVGGIRKLIDASHPDTIIQALSDFVLHDLLLTLLNPLSLIFGYVTFRLLSFLTGPAIRFFSASLARLGQAPLPIDLLLDDIKLQKKSYARIVAIPFILAGVIFLALPAISSAHNVADLMVVALKQDGSFMENAIKATIFMAILCTIFIVIGATIATIWITARNAFSAQYLMDNEVGVSGFQPDTSYPLATKEPALPPIRPLAGSHTPTFSSGFRSDRYVR